MDALMERSAIPYLCALFECDSFSGGSVITDTPPCEDTLSVPNHITRDKIAWLGTFGVIPNGPVQEAEPRSSLPKFGATETTSGSPKYSRLLRNTGSLVAC